MRSEGSASFCREQRLVPREPSAHLPQRAVQQAGNVRLGEAERLRHFRLRSLQEEPLEDDEPLAPVERPCRAGDESAVETELLERRRPVGSVLVIQRRRVGQAGQRPRPANQRAAVAQVTEQLALDATDDVGRELDRTRCVPAIDGSNEGERGHLDEILVPLW
jgi:hypothetical protein